MASTNVHDVTERDFEQQVLQSPTPVLVDFWAPWCGPCRQVAPVVEALSDEYVGKVKFTKLNTDDSPEIPMRYGIMGIPTLIVFQNGQPVQRLVGAHPKGNIKKMLDAVLG